MNTEQARWLRRYQEALHKHLKQGRDSSPQLAQGLGHQAVALGLEPLDVARFHEQAMKGMRSPVGSLATRQKAIKRAELFFTETIVPIEKTHRAALKAIRHVKQLTAALDCRSSGLVVSRQYLKRRIAQRIMAEKVLLKSREHYAKLLEESQHLQEHLRHLTHRIISAQERERKKVSGELHDEIAQTLLGINVRLLTLRTGAATNAGQLKKELASTQRLVGKSVKIMARYTHELGNHHET